MGNLHQLMLFSPSMEPREAAKTLIGNPFSTPPKQWRAASKRLLKESFADLVSKLVDKGEVHDAKRVVLAYGHLAACGDANENEEVLPKAALPARVMRALPRSRDDYLGVVMAAGRCYHALKTIQGDSVAMQRVRTETWAACFGDSLVHALTLATVIHDHDVLILGETGTGKEAIAQAIQEGTRGGAKGEPAPRSALNAAAVPETLIESELFGHVKGAFTGASDARMGRIRMAHGGCFFLDEVGDLKETTQVKLLRVIETDLVSPLGADTSFRSDVRYVAATHKDLEGMVEEGRFRRDLYQRLAGNVIVLPALRERPDDIPEIGMAFVERHLPATGFDETRARIVKWLESPEAQRYAWPGNVRELQNALRNLLLGLNPGIGEARAALSEEMSQEDLPPALENCVATLQDAEDWYLRRVLQHTDNNYAQAARILGVDRTTVRRKTRLLRTGKA